MQTSKQQRERPRHGSIYIAVTGVAMILSLIGLTSMHLSRLELRTTSNLQDQNYARIQAISAVELALAQTDRYADWRTLYAHGAENVMTPNFYNASLYFKYLDHVDGDLGNNSTDPVEVQGIGRIGGATFVYSVTFEASVTSSQQVSPPSLRNFEPGSSTWSSTTIDSFYWVGQYFLPNLPAEATSWAVTSIEVQMAKNGPASSTLDAGLYLPDGSLKPGTLIETIAVPESSLPTSAGTWHVFPFSNATNLNPAVGLCLTLTTVSSPASDLDYESGGVSEPNSALLTNGGSNWISESDKSLYYRVRGYYTTSSGTGAFTITPGSWQSTAAP